MHVSVTIKFADVGMLTNFEDNFLVFKPSE